MADLTGHTARHVREEIDGAFADLPHRVFRCLNIEHELFEARFARILVDFRLDAPVDDGAYVDEIAIAGQHEIGIAGLSGAMALFGTDPESLLNGHLRQLNFFDRIRQPVVQPRRLLADVFAEAHHHAHLVRVDPEKECVPREHADGHGRGQKQQRPRHTRAMHRLLHAILAALEHLFEVGGLLIAAATPTAAPGTASAAPTLTPRAAAATLAAFAAAALIAPGHYLSLSVV